MPPLSPLGTAVTFVRSLLFALAFYGVTIPMLLAAALASPRGARGIAPIGELWARQHRFLARWLLGQKVVVEGTIPDKAQFIVCKHESMFETLDMICLVHRPMVAAKKELTQIPLWGPIARAYGLIVVNRGAGASALRSIRAEARAAFEAGRPVLFFPEGTRVPHGEAPPLRAGFAGLYAVLDCPVVPVAVDSGRLSPRNSFLKRAGTITYRFGAEIPPGLPRREAEARVHAAINALNKTGDSL